MQYDDFRTPEEKRAQRRAEKQARSDLEQDNSVIQSIMASVAGRSYMYRLLSRCNIWHSSFQNDPYRTAFNEGQRNVGLQLLGDINRACAAQFIEMIQEQQDARRQPDTPVLDRYDHDDERNYDSAGRWIGLGDGPDE